jgi:hypothetical protein
MGTTSYKEYYVLIPSRKNDIIYERCAYRHNQFRFSLQDALKRDELKNFTVNFDFSSCNFAFSSKRSKKISPKFRQDDKSELIDFIEKNVI